MEKILLKKRRWIIKIMLVFVLAQASLFSFAQSPTDELPGDPGAISVFTVQHMNFGTFCSGSIGGTVVISNAGSRSVTGDVVGLTQGVSFFQSIFEIDAPAGTIISILNGPNATLPGSNGGSMSLQINNSAPASPFSTTIPSPGRTQVSIGGTLTIGSPVATPPGVYSGTFYITFNQE